MSVHDTVSGETIPSTRLISWEAIWLLATVEGSFTPDRFDYCQENAEDIPSCEISRVTRVRVGGKNAGDRHQAGQTSAFTQPRRNDRLCASATMLIPTVAELPACTDWRKRPSV